jgi:hypothetical protein
VVEQQAVPLQHTRYTFYWPAVLQLFVYLSTLVLMGGL